MTWMDGLSEALIFLMEPPEEGSLPVFELTALEPWRWVIRKTFHRSSHAWKDTI